MPKLPVLDASDLLHALKKAGFIAIRQRGSHVRLRHPDGRVTTVPVHADNQIARGLLSKILRDTELTVDELNQLMK